MILTTCAACAAPLAHNAPRCVRCWTRYCNATLVAANNYADFLICLKRLEDAKALLRKITPVARRVFGEHDDATLRIRRNYARALFRDPGATLDDVREAVATLVETARISRQVLGGAHPITMGIESDLRNARAVLRARETSA